MSDECKCFRCGKPLTYSDTISDTDVKMCNVFFMCETEDCDIQEIRVKKLKSRGIIKSSEGEKI